MQLSDTQWLNMYFEIIITIGFDVNSDYMLENGAIELRCNKITDSMPVLVQNNILTNHSCHHWICFYGPPDWIARAESQYLKLRFYFATMIILLLCTIQTFRILKPIINYRCDQCCKLKRILILFAWSLCIMAQYLWIAHDTIHLIHIYTSNLLEIFQRANKWL